ncbi:SDR family NAD(P)-dependent oxidoreductase [Halomontanus rarus]|uniref:SDR family NAD(P)-dependent oxidoreductase n=1 Tax=Halomontanus rarus TaxID=3034020 RepID=UPI0023E8D77A|nr:glucose 1-dehydrogenase [Halovivax sp. TS33]
MVGQTSYDYTGESAIVTGSTKGIGRGIAAALVDAGANVAINSRTETAVEETVAELEAKASGEVIGVAADMGSPEEIEDLVATAIEAFGEIDLLVNNAAVWPREESMVEASLEDWEYTMNVNVRSQFYASKLVSRHMIENGIEGSIVNHSSQTGDRRAGGRGLYGTSKTAINGLTWRMAHDLAHHGIRMNAISTDVTETYQLEKEARMIADDDPDRTSEDVLREWGESRPLGRLGRPADLANAVLWLGSEQASYVVGTIVRVSGGGNLQ